MNYYNPYFSMYPYASSTLKTGLFSKLFSSIKGINFSSIISGTGKTLNVINQALPLVKQAKPVLNNAKTMFKVMNEFKKVNTPTINKKKENISTITSKKQEKSTAGPNFFI